MKQVYGTEYAPVLIANHHWKVHKFCSHHWSYLGYYEVKVMTAFGPPEFVCTCQAGRNCKHIAMIVSMLNPKKDLF